MPDLTYRIRGPTVPGTGRAQARFYPAQPPHQSRTPADVEQSVVRPAAGVSYLSTGLAIPNFVLKSLCVGKLDMFP